MATLQARIEGYIGSVTETTVMNSALQEAVNNLVQVLPVDKALQYATEKTAVASTGISISGRLFDVRVNDRPSKQVSTSTGKQITTAGTNNSIYKSSTTFPVHWVYGGKVYGHPSASDLYAYVLEAPTISSSDSLISGMPQGTDEISILYSCQSILSVRLNSLSTPTIYSLPSVPSAPTTTDMVEPSVTTPTIGVTSLTPTTIAALDSLTAFVAPTFSAPTEPTTELTDLSLPDPPNVPGAPNIAYSDVSAQAIAAVTVGSIPDAPTYSAPASLTNITDLTAGAMDDGTIASDTSIKTPAQWFSTLGKIIEKEEDPELASQSIAKMQSYLDLLRTDLESSNSAFNASVEKFRQDSQKVFSQAEIDIQKALRQAELTNNVNLQNELQTLQGVIAEYRADIEHYTSQIQSYQAQASVAIDAWRAEVLERHIAFYINKYQNALQLYAQDMQKQQLVFESALNEWKEEAARKYEQARITLQEQSAELQTGSQEEITQANLDLQAQVQQHELEQNRINVLVNNYATQIQSYGSEVQSISSKYQLELAKFQADQQDLLGQIQYFSNLYTQKLQLLIASNDGAELNRAGS
jgi:hypothetical protein